MSKPILHASASLAAALAALVLLGSGCNRSDAKAGADAEPPKPVRVTPIARADMTDILSYVTDLRAYAEVKVYSPVPDRILYFPWKDGDFVGRGERIALIRKEGLDKGLEQMMAQAESLDVQIKNLEAELARSKGLLEANVITRQTFDQIQTQYLSLLAQRKALEASRGQLAVTAGNAIITAAIGGVIAGKMLETGDMAVPQIPLCQLLQVDKLKASIKLIETDVSKVKLGQEVTLALDAYPDQTFKGAVSAIMPFLDPGTRTNTVEITLDNPKDQTSGQYLLKPGMFGRASIVVGVKPKVVTVPEVALLLDNALVEQQRQGNLLRRAFVVQDNVAKEKIVRLGARQGTLWEVLEGINEGDRIVVRGHHALKDGQKVEVMEAAKL